MKARLVMIAALVAGTASSAQAQCSAAALPARQACYASVDLVNYMTPQLATAIAGGSSTLGQSGALGGLGRFALTIRGTAVMNGAIPNIQDVPFRLDGQPQAYTTDSKMIPGVGVDFSVGLWKGVSLGATHVGAIDGIVSALYVPDVEGEDGDFSIKAKDGNLKFGFGVRVGVLDESIVTPGVYISYLQRDLPTVSLSGTADNGSFNLNDFSVKTTAWRVVAAKNFMILGLQAGIGQDTYKSSASIIATANATQATGSASMSMTRNNMFVGASLDFFIGKLVAEYGQVSGGSLAPTFNSFDGSTTSAAASRTYLSGGLRIAF